MDINDQVMLNWLLMIKFLLTKLLMFMIKLLTCLRPGY